MVGLLNNSMSQNSKVLALKYRPQVFEDLIGQEVVAETIFNSIKSKKTVNAYLFTGIRGIGKTTFARIVAKSLNCENGVDKLCKENFCKHCESIINSNHIDVLEMDAASKTGVDDVRDLIEFSRYGPTSAKFKIFIIDEVHMLSKQAFNALLKTLEEPPEYLKFIFATTEIKKIPITVVSRCQRFELSRVKSEQLFNFLKQITIKENGKVSDDALKLIVKISEGSVRDALSLLDRGLMTYSNGDELTLSKAQNIYGYFDKSSLLDLFEDLFKGEEESVIKRYRKIFDAGVDPKVFLNDFLEILYYIKNISSIKLHGTNFSLNDDEFNKISNISNQLATKDLLLFWHFTINAIDEIEIVSNQNLSVEMFLIRLMHLKYSKKIDISEDEQSTTPNSKKNDDIISSKGKIVEQIKNITQEEKSNPKIKSDETINYLSVDNLENLIQLCNVKKEMKLKYELENNVNLVSFSKGRIEIAFNDNLDKDFIKDISIKLYEWTNERWIISLSKNEGQISKKQEEKNKKVSVFNKTKKSDIYKKVLQLFSDAELIEVEEKDEQNE